jgi:hypothetical protein
MTMLPYQVMTPLLEALDVSSCIDKTDLYSALPKLIREANQGACSC